MPLICAATPGELNTGPEWDNTVRVVSGVGIPATFATLYVRLLQEKKERGEETGLLTSFLSILNIGIAGAYPGTGLEIGDIVIATSEVYGDIGMELPPPPSEIPGQGAASGFLPVAETPFGRAWYPAPYPTVLPEQIGLTLPEPKAFRVHHGRGCTVNTCTGTESVGRRRATQFQAIFETMEGAAVAHIGQLFGHPVCEIRAISNFASDRDMRPENIRLALAHLRQFLAAISKVGDNRSRANPSHDRERTELTRLDRDLTR